MLRHVATLDMRVVVLCLLYTKKWAAWGSWAGDRARLVLTRDAAVGQEGGAGGGATGTGVGAGVGVGSGAGATTLPSPISMIPVIRE